MIWQSPKYRFRVPVDPDDDGCGPLKEVVIDVTGSAPAFSSPGTRLGGALDKVLAAHASRSRFTVLDLGAGKFRNALYVLEQCPHSHVWAVEYESLKTSSDQAQDLLKKATAYGKRFHDVSFPHEFVNCALSFDLILLINVLSVMPVPPERLLLLSYCYARLKPNGRLFWYSQHGETDYAPGGSRCNDTTRCGDGFYIGGNKFVKTFFREFNGDEVDEMMLSTGFLLDRSYATSKNLARLYAKRPPAVLAGRLSPAQIESISSAGVGIPDPENVECRIVQRQDGVAEVRPDLPTLQFDALCIATLQSISPGNADATMFHRFADLVLRRSFRGRLRKWSTEREVNKGRKRIDLLAKNYADAGFFQRARDHFKISCPYVVVECKNYGQDIGNPEMDQLAGRLNPARGQLGILVCRSVEDEDATLDRARDYRDDGKYIVVLTDPDLVRLCECVRDDDVEGIDDLMEEKLDALLL